MKNKGDIKGIRDEKRGWERRTLKACKGKVRERRKRFKNLSHMDVARLYTPIDTEGINYLADLGFPGEYPYTRGIYPTMYRGRLWTMRQFAGFGTAEETNERFRYLLGQGQMGLSVAFDLPTLMGYDSDSPLSKGEVGRCGAAVDTLEDMEVLFKGIPLDSVTTSMTINAPAQVLFAMYIAVAVKQGVSPKQIGGTIQNDILKEYISQKEWIYPPEAHLKLIRDTIIYSATHTPRFHPISISGYHIREAGSTAVQELAFTLYNGLTYVEEVTKAGLSVDDFAPRLSFFFNSHNDFFEEIAKFRAARRIWAREIRKRYNPVNPESCALRFHTQTAGCTLTAQQPYNNIVRVTLQALAGVLGGTQSLHTDSMDETFALPTEKAVTIALRTQQIIAHESGAADTIDPLGGSYYLESLTNSMEDECYKYFKRLDRMGGMVAAIRRGFPQDEICEAACRYQQEIDNGERIIVGVNEFVMDEDTAPMETLKIDLSYEKRQIERLDRIKKRRDGIGVLKALDDIKRAAEGDENLMPYLVNAVGVYATVGEICDALKAVYGTYDEPAGIKGPKKVEGIRKKVLMCKAGLDGHDRGIKVVAAFLMEHGIEVIYTGLRKTPEEIVRRAVEENVHAICVSVLTGAHKAWFPRIINMLRLNGREDIVVFGGGIIPEEDIGELKRIGVREVFLPATPLERILKFVKGI